MKSYGTTDTPTNGDDMTVSWEQPQQESTKGTGGHHGRSWVVPDNAGISILLCALLVGIAGLALIANGEDLAPSSKTRMFDPSTTAEDDAIDLHGAEDTLRSMVKTIGVSSPAQQKPKYAHVIQVDPLQSSPDGSDEDAMTTAMLSVTPPSPSPITTAIAVALSDMEERVESASYYAQEARSYARIAEERAANVTAMAALAVQREAKAAASAKRELASLRMRMIELERNCSAAIEQAKAAAAAATRNPVDPSDVEALQFHQARLSRRLSRLESVRYQTGQVYQDGKGIDDGVYTATVIFPEAFANIPHVTLGYSYIFAHRETKIDAFVSDVTTRSFKVTVKVYASLHHVHIEWIATDLPGGAYTLTNLPL